MSGMRMDKGWWGEQKAASYLKDRGFDLLAHNWKDPQFRIQIDLVVLKSGRAYVVEVKNHRWIGSGFEHIMTWKQRERLLHFARKLHDLKYKKYSWGFMWIWIKENECQILESFEF